MTWLDSNTPAASHPSIRYLARVDASAPWSLVAAPAGKDRRLCQVRGCRHVLRHPEKQRACPRCSLTRWRVNNPVRTAWANLRDSARKRRVEFALSLEEFAAFVAGNGYLEGKGRECGALHIDRVNPLEGYRLENIRVLEAGENSRKGAGEDKRAHYLAARRGEPQLFAHCPF